MMVYTRSMKKYPKGQAREIVPTKWSKEEKAKLKDVARRRKMSVSAYLRWLAEKDSEGFKINEK